MYNWQLPLALTLKELGIASLLSFDRKLMQRYVYLLQSVGYPLKYGFTWSFVSTYSEDLLEDAVDAIPCIEGIPSEMRLDEPCLKAIEMLKKLDGLYMKYDRPRMDWLNRLVATAYGTDIDDDAKKEYASFRKKAEKLFKKKQSKENR